MKFYSKTKKRNLTDREMTQPWKTSPTVGVRACHASKLTKAQRALNGLYVPTVVEADEAAGPVFDEVAGTVVITKKKVVVLTPEEQETARQKAKPEHLKKAENGYRQFMASLGLPEGAATEEFSEAMIAQIKTAQEQQSVKRAVEELFPVLYGFFVSMNVMVKRGEYDTGRSALGDATFHPEVVQ